MEMDDELLEIRQMFVQEAFELVEGLEKQFLILDEHCESIDALNEVFRIAHSLKGSSAAVGLDLISSFAHKFENLLTLLRLRPDLNTKDRTGLMLETTDILKESFSKLSQNESVDADLIDLIMKRINTEAALLETEIETKAKTSVATPATKEHAQEESEQNAEKKGQPASSSQQLKVSIERLNTVQQVVGELATLRGQLLSNLSEPRQLQLVLGLMDKNIRELNDRVLEMKKSSIDPLKQRISRVVRDTAHKLQKTVLFDFYSNQELLEKPVLDALVDPLMHMVRNSLDHGLETGEERLLKGKPEAGMLKVEIIVEPTVVDVIIRDDGRGIDHLRILRKAQEKGIVTAEAENWPRDKILQLLFAPGFSTAEQVSEFSGRGVGLDVVRSNIEALGGVIKISTEIDKGTKFNLQIPQTNGLSEALTIRHNNRSYLVSINGVVRVISIDRKRILTPGPDMIMYSLAGQHHQLFPLDTDLDDMVIPDKSAGIIVQVNSSSFCIPVDYVGSKSQHMIKPIGRWVSTSPGMLGMSIIGDGTPVPFLDLKKLIIERINIKRNLQITA